MSVFFFIAHTLISSFMGSQRNTQSSLQKRERFDGMYRQVLAKRESIPWRSPTLLLRFTLLLYPAAIPCCYTLLRFTLRLSPAFLLMFIYNCVYWSTDVTYDLCYAFLFSKLCAYLSADVTYVLCYVFPASGVLGIVNECRGPREGHSHPSWHPWIPGKGLARRGSPRSWLPAALLLLRPPSRSQPVVLALVCLLGRGSIRDPLRLSGKC